MSKIVKNVKHLAKKKTKKELEEELALKEQTMDILADADTTPIAVDTASLPHYALAETVAAGAAVATDAAVATTATAAAATIPTWAYVAGGAALLGGVGAAAGGGSSSSTPVVPTAPTDTISPIFTSPSTATTAENIAINTVVYDANATDDNTITYSLTGADASLFDINTATGEVKFNNSPDFENPTDNGTDNVYNFTVTATDAAGNSANQAVALTVTDIDDSTRTGYTTTDFGEYDWAYSVQLDSSGNIYLGGFSDVSGTYYDFALAKYTSTGELDSSFGGGDGMVTTDFGGGSDWARGVQLDSSGNIYLGGYSYGNFALAKYTPAGELDSSFGGGDGKLTTDFGGEDYAWGVQLDSSGNIYLGGYSAGNFVLAKYTPAGELDSSFGGGDGKLTTDFGGEDYAWGVQLDSSGNIYLGGYSAGNFVLAKYTPAGELDSSFGGGDGKLTTDFGGEDYAWGVQLDSSGNIYLGGYSYVNGTSDFVLAKYTPAGELDTSFGDGGKLTTDFGGEDYAYDVQLDSSGNIYLGGYSDDDFALAKYTSTGELDSSFGGGDGMVTTDFDRYDRAWGVQLDSSGNIYLGGGSYGNFALAKYTPTGELDSSFGNLAVL